MEEPFNGAKNLGSDGWLEVKLFQAWEMSPNRNECPDSRINRELIDTSL
jgi:hypothetical protein